MNIPIAIRNWHIKVGLIVAIPIVLAGMTAVLMAHNKDLGLRNISAANMAWLPGYRDAKESTSTAADLEIRTTLTTKDGRYLLGTRYGLYELRENRLFRIEALPAKEIRAIVESPNGLLCAGRGGVWQNNGKGWRRIFKGDAYTVENRSPQLIRIATREKGLQDSTDDGKHWTPVAALNRLPVNLPSNLQQEELTMGRLALDLHTGRAFLGREWAWLWIDLAGLSLVLLAFSGVFLWSRHQSKPSHVRRADIKTVALPQASSL
ncbi:MAG: putative rane protein [Vampirovibrio sp.]|jgi:hypothetical protein|nr:putative rane protein [Vampirovibrio sp.]